MENQIQSAENTNVVEAGGTEVGTQAVPGQTENSASVEQGKQEAPAQETRGGVQGGAAESGQNGASAEQGKTNPKQDAATNKRFADIRRSYEGKLKAAQAERDAAVKAKEVEMVKSLYKTNQWTGKAIEDEYDVEEFLAMKALSEEGHDPITAYSEQLKQNKRNAAQEARAKADESNQKKTRAGTYLKEFREKYKDVSVSELLENKDFMDFGGEALEIMPLTKVYEAYVSFKGKQAEVKKQEAMTANAQVSVGSVTSVNEGADGSFFTREQVLKMSPAEISKNYEKIRESQMKW